MRITSPAFQDGAPIPRRYTCDGDDSSPQLDIADVPATAASLALIMDDPDAPGGTWIHWLIWDLPASTTTLPEATTSAPDDVAIAKATQGTNDFGNTGYGGPCPPRGPHTYRFLLYALSGQLELRPDVTRAELDAAMESMIVARAELRGTYARAAS